MKYILRLHVVLIILLFSGLVYGQIEEQVEHEIILMGKVTHAEYGSPIKNYEVYIVSDSIESAVMDYFNIVTTDDEGFYYDTVNTFLDAGTLVVYTYDFDNNKQESDVHFRFMDSSNDNVFISNFEVELPFQQPNLQALFTYFQNENHSKYHFAFVDQTENDHIISWKWSFGDNTISYEQNPKHTFPSPGVYKVELTVEAIVVEHVEINTISEYIYIPAFAYYHLGGHCFAENFPIDEGQAYLYHWSDLEFLKAVDTAKIDTLGYYYFYQVQEGKYCIKAQPGNKSEYYSVFAPTYYGDELFWEDALLILHENTNWEYNVQLIEGIGTASGEGLISGQVTMGESLMGIQQEEILEGIDVYLLDEYDNPLSSRYTDEEGNFDFEELALDTYWMCQEMTGVPRTKVRIELNESNPEVTDISIDMTTGDITLDIAENPWFHEPGSPYPNPAVDHVSLSVDMKSNAVSTVELIDLQGRTLKQMGVNLHSGMNIINLRLDGLNNGLYFVRLDVDGITVNKQLIISR